MMLHSTREGLEVRTAAGADRWGEIWGGQAFLVPPRCHEVDSTHLLVVRTQSPDGQEKGSELIFPNPDGLGAELCLPHVLINFWHWAGTISQVKVMYALWGFNCVIVNFVKFFHDKVQI